MTTTSSAIVEITRGDFVESTHQVDIVVADTQGKLVSVWGEADRMVFPRSSVKSFQALPLVESGAADACGFDDRHLALACSSHNGEQMHVNLAGEMLEKAGCEPKCLECGGALPRFMDDRMKLKDGPQAIHNPCSGKHAGFLAFASHAGFRSEGYVSFDHPVQREIAGVMEAVTMHPHTKDNYGIDGCAIPTYFMPLDKLAVAYAKFSVEEDPSPTRSSAMKRIREACMKHPEMVAGSKRSCTRLMQVLKGRAFVKYGAEGVYTASLPEHGLGIAMKARDGNVRAIEVAIATVVSRYLELSENEENDLKPLIQPEIKNHNGLKVGFVRMKL